MNSAKSLNHKTDPYYIIKSPPGSPLMGMANWLRKRLNIMVN